MRLIIQRVAEAEVRIENGESRRIGTGLLVLTGIEENDEKEDVEWLARKITQLRIFPDDEGVMNLSLMDIKAELMVISQFTLHALTKKGNRPSYIRAARPEKALPIYTLFINLLEEIIGQKVATGEFGAMMDIHLINTGPVTLFMDSKNKE